MTSVFAYWTEGRHVPQSSRPGRLRTWCIVLWVAGALAAVLQTQDPPPPFIHYQPPSWGDIHAEYRCSAEVSLHLRQGYRSGIRVVGYSGIAGSASEDDLQRWNDRLSSIEHMSAYTFWCSAGQETVIISGQDRRDRRQTQVIAVWGRDHLWLLPYSEPPAPHNPSNSAVER
jgi:hypothetical protein